MKNNVSRTTMRELRYRSLDRLKNSHERVTEDLFRRSSSAFAEKLNFIKEDIKKDFVYKNTEPLNI